MPANFTSPWQYQPSVETGSSGLSSCWTCCKRRSERQPPQAEPAGLGFTRIHLQRVVGAFVGAAQFYNTKVTQARDLTSKLTNDDRDEDSDGVYGFDTKAARAFARQARLTAYTLLAVAEGAVHTYAAITGDDWKPYEVPFAPAATINRKSAAAELDALA